MPSPVPTLGTVGNVVGGPSGLSVAKSTTVAAFLDLSSAWEGHLTCEVTTGASAPTVGTMFYAYEVYGAATANALASSVAQGATSMTLTASNPGFRAGQRILLQQAGGSKLGEIVAIGAGYSGGATIPISAAVNAYSAGDAAYLIGQTPVAAASPSASWAVTQDYSVAMVLPTGQYAIAAANADASAAVTVTVTMGLKVASYA